MAGPVGSPWVVLTLNGELDMSRSDELDGMAANVFSDDQVNAIFDLSDVAFMDSSALRWLLKVQEGADQTGSRLRLVAPEGGSLLRLLSLTGLADRFAVFPTRTDAEQPSPDMTESSDDRLPSLRVVQ
jgi:anti-anti-sigma factor